MPASVNTSITLELILNLKEVFLHAGNANIRASLPMAFFVTSGVSLQLIYTSFSRTGGAAIGR
jgi:hypothetical protein